MVALNGPTKVIENKALATAIAAFVKGADAEATGALTNFLTEFPKSPWKGSILVNLGNLYRATGYWSKALSAWEEAWLLLASSTEPRAKELGDDVLGNLAQMYARLGRFDQLEALLAQTKDRDVRGPATEKVAEAKQGLGLMKNHPERAFRCGPMALDRILVATNPGQSPRKPVIESESSSKGMSLQTVADLARQLGMNYQMAKRSPGSRVIYPAVVNWRVGHFAALTKELNGKFLSQDPTFTDDVWVSQAALDEESSGYYLVPKGKLPAGWASVDSKEAATIWGRGNAGSFTPSAPPCVAPTVQCSICEGNDGMAGYNVDSARVGLSINDTPVQYTPPVGPAVKFVVSYAQREVPPVSTANFSNLGNKWSFNWISYIVVDPNNTAADAHGYGPGGGTLDYGGFDSNTQSYAPQIETQVSLVKVATASYEKRFPDGSKEVFNLADGATSYPQKIFMTAKSILTAMRSSSPTTLLLESLR